MSGIGKKLSLGERIALAATGGHDDDFPEDIEYETSAKVVDGLDDEEEIRPHKPVRSSLRTKNVKLLEELDSRYAGAKVSRKKLAKSEGLEERSPSKSRSGGGAEPIKISVVEDGDEIEGEFDDMRDDDLSDEDDDDGSEPSGVYDETGSEDNELSPSGPGLSKKQTKQNDDESDEGEESESENEDSEVDEDDEDTEEDEAEEGDGAVGMQTLSLRDKEAEIEKGKATLNQIRMWDSLLEVRIRLQKMLLECNRLPHTEAFEELYQEIKKSEGTSSLQKTMEKSQEAIKVLMQELIHLQDVMTTKNSETKKALSKKDDINVNEDPMNEEITSEEEVSDDGLEKSESEKRKRKADKHINIERDYKQLKYDDFELAVGDGFRNFIPHRNQIIQKWNDKTQFAGGKFNRKSASQVSISTLKQIEQILSNKERLLKRTQIKRSNHPRIGESSPENSVDGNLDKADPEVFDDDDFYHQLLRELIERKTSNINDPVQLSHHWLELQKLRTKLKRRVDTKASKGRKIRYDVHTKLVNFMAPQDNCIMASVAVNELFSSLFGKTKQ